VKYAWVDKQRGHYPLDAMCAALSISASGFFSWRRGGQASKRLTDTQLLTLIKALHAEIKAAYGWP